MRLPPGPLERLEVLLTFALLAVFALGVPALVALLRAHWLGLRRPGRWLAAGGVAAAFGLRALAPGRLVMVHVGYGLTDTAIQLDGLTRWGATATVVHHLALALLPPDHRSILALHGLLGACTVVLAALWLARVRPRPDVAHRADAPKGRPGHAGTLAPLRNAPPSIDRPPEATGATRSAGRMPRTGSSETLRWDEPAACGAFLWALWLGAATPLLVHDHRSESILVVAVFLLWSGNLLLDRFLLRGRRLDLLAAVAAFDLAAATRPELPVVVAGFAATGLWLRRRQLPAARRRPLIAALCMGLLCLLPHALHVQHAVRVELSRGSVPGLDPRLPLRILGGWATDNALVRPACFPPVLTVLAVGALATAPRRLTAALWALLLLWLAPSFIDLPEQSIPRLHAPAAHLAVLLAALTLSRLHAAAAARRPGLGAALLATVLPAGLIAASAGPTIPSLWAWTNADSRERLARRAVAALPRGACLVRLGRTDLPAGDRTHVHFPDYLVEPERPRSRVLAIGARRRGDCPAGRYFLLDLSCYARNEPGIRSARRRIRPTCRFGWPCAAAFFEHPGWKAPPRRGLRAPCAEALAEARGPAIFEDRIVSAGDNEFGYYGDRPSFRVGLFRLGSTAHPDR